MLESKKEVLFGELYHSEPQHTTPVRPLVAVAGDSKPRTFICWLPEIGYEANCSDCSYLYRILFFLSLSRRFSRSICHHLFNAWCLTTCMDISFSSPVLHGSSREDRSGTHSDLRFQEIVSQPGWHYSNWPIWMRAFTFRINLDDIILKY